MADQREDKLKSAREKLDQFRKKKMLVMVGRK